MRLPGFGAARRVLGKGPFRTYTTGNFISLVGTWMQRISVGYLTWELTHSTVWLGLMALADLCPTLIIGPFAGVMADRWSKYRLLISTQALGLLQASLLALFHQIGMLEVILLFSITLILGVINALAQPARLALISSMVSRDLLASAVAVNAISFNLARFLGPAGAGLLIATAGITWSFIANALSYGVMILSLLAMPRETRDTPAPTTRKFGHDLAEGLLYVFRDRATAAAMAVLVVTGICSRPLIEMLPAFSGAVFHGGGPALAALTSSIGIGAVLGGSWISSRQKPGSMTRAMLVTSLIAALGVIAFTAVDTLYLALPVIVCIGFCWVSTSICSQTLLQLGAPDAMRGRVLALYGLIIKAAPAIGAVLAGTLADYFGLRSTVAAGAVIVTLHMIVQLRFAHVISDGLEPKPADG